MKQIMECPVCKKDIKPTECNEFCALCSMQVEDTSLSIEFSGIKKYFCCEICQKKFESFYEVKNEVLL